MSKKKSRLLQTKYAQKTVLLLSLLRLFQFDSKYLKSLNSASDLAVFDRKLANLALEEVAKVGFFEWDRGGDIELIADIFVFVDTNNRALAVLGLFNGVSSRVFAIDGDRRKFGGDDIHVSACGKGCHRYVEHIRKLYGITVAQSSLVRIE